MSDTVNQTEGVNPSKAVIDFIWEWTEGYADWSRILVSKLVSHETQLTSEERKEIFDMFLESLDLKKRLERAGISKPRFDGKNISLKLISLDEVKGVNQLADGQIINFSDCLTVVFGMNGSGKTGYGRILKSLGFSYETETKILSDVNYPAIPQSARIKYTADEIDKEFKWEGKQPQNELRAISVFNNNCVNISLGDDRSLIVSPSGFYIFELISAELNHLTDLLNQEINKYQVVFSWVAALKPNTPQSNFINALDKKSSIEKLTEISLYGPEHEASTAELKTRLEGLNKSLLEKEILELRKQYTEIESALSTIKNTQKNFTITEFNTFKECNKSITILETQTKKGLSEIAEANGIALYESKEFLSFLKAADQYLALLDKPDYPTAKEDVCLYCSQPLEARATDLLKNYRIILNDTTQDQIRKLSGQKDAIVLKAKLLNSEIIFHQSTFGTNEDGSVIQPVLIAEYNLIVSNLLQHILSNSLTEESKFDIDYNKYISFLEMELEEIKTKGLLKNETLLKLSESEMGITTKLNELSDRKLLSEKIEEIKDGIEKKKIIALLESKKSHFSTTSLSKKTTEAREALVKQNFEQKFRQELASLRKSHIKIDLNFGTQKGNSKLLQKIRSLYSLKDVLSEGEQKAVALAEFLAELQLNNSNSPVIFDDPVNSLDHTIIDDVARRLIRLSQERQVVIFTHSVLLFNEIIGHCGSQGTYKTLPKRLYDSTKNFDKTGYITESEDGINSVKYYLTKINNVINSTKEEKQKEAELATKGYGYLRSAIELLVELEIFKGTVKRYQKNVAFSKFAEIDGELLNGSKATLVEIFERSCGYIDGHSSPEEKFDAPTLNSLQMDVDKFKAVRESFEKSVLSKTNNKIVSNVSISETPSPRNV